MGLLALLIGLTAATLPVELVMRAFVPLDQGPGIAPDAHDPLLYRMEPSSTGLFKGMLGRRSTTYVQTNTAGFRDREFARTITPGRRRILCFGDSFCFGSGVAEFETFPRQLEGLLQAKGHTIEIYNFGTPGFSARQSVRLARRTDREFAHHGYIFYFNQTDLKGEVSLPASGVDRFFSSLGVYRFYRLVAKPWFFSSVAQAAADLENELVALERETADFHCLVLTADVSVQLTQVLIRRRLRFVDVTAIHRNPAYHLSRFDPHLNGAGYARVAQLAYETLFPSRLEDALPAPP
jgi:lysophospholipase L1-like esterase